MYNKIDGRIVDGRYSKPVDKVDKGAMSSNKIPLPVKKAFKPITKLDDVTPKQVIRQKQARRMATR